MILPFVREVFAELEHSSGFERVRRHLSLGAGRRRVSGLTATARALYQKRLRYLIGRYGYSPHLLAWEFFNEIDNVFGPLNGDDVVAWHRQMGQWLHAHDPYGHLVTTSLTGDTTNHVRAPR